MQQGATQRHEPQLMRVLRSYADNFPELANFFVWDAEGVILYDSSSQALSVQPLNFGTVRINASGSVGVATLRPEDASADSVLARADAALYRAKDGGRNQVQLTQ